MAKNSRYVGSRLATTVNARYYPDEKVIDAFYLDGRFTTNSESRVAQQSHDREDRGFLYALFAYPAEKGTVVDQTAFAGSIRELTGEVKQGPEPIDTQINDLADLAIEVGGKATLMQDGVRQPYFAGLIVKEGEIAAVTTADGCAFLFRSNVLYPLTAGEFELEAIDLNGNPVQHLRDYAAGVAGTIRYSNLAQIQADDCLLLCNRDIIEILGQREILQILAEAKNQEEAATSLVTAAAAKQSGVSLQVMVANVDYVEDMSKDEQGKVHSMTGRQSHGGDRGYSGSQPPQQQQQSQQPPQTPPAAPYYPQEDVAEQPRQAQRRPGYQQTHPAYETADNPNETPAYPQDEPQGSEAGHRQDQTFMPPYDQSQATIRFTGFDTEEERPLASEGSEQQDRPASNMPPQNQRPHAQESNFASYPGDEFAAGQAYASGENYPDYQQPGQPDQQVPNQGYEGYPEDGFPDYNYDNYPGDGYPEGPGAGYNPQPDGYNQDPYADGGQYQQPHGGGYDQYGGGYEDAGYGDSAYRDTGYQDAGYQDTGYQNDPYASNGYQEQPYADGNYYYDQGQDYYGDGGYGEAGYDDGGGYYDDQGQGYYDDGSGYYDDGQGQDIYGQDQYQDGIYYDEYQDPYYDDYQQNYYDDPYGEFYEDEKREKTKRIIFYVFLVAIIAVCIFILVRLLSPSGDSKNSTSESTSQTTTVNTTEEKTTSESTTKESKPSESTKPSAETDPQTGETIDKGEENPETPSGDNVEDPNQEGGNANTGNGQEQVYVIKGGDTFYAILQSYYERTDQEVVNLVLEANPQIDNIEVLIEGMEVVLPPLP